MKEIKDLEEWGYGGSGSIDMYIHDSGTAQIRIHRDPDRDREYHVTFKFEGGDGIIEVTASDAKRVATRDEAEETVREFVQFFDEEIDECYYTPGHESCNSFVC